MVQLRFQGSYFNRKVDWNNQNIFEDIHHENFRIYFPLFPESGKYGNLTSDFNLNFVNVLSKKMYSLYLLSFFFIIVLIKCYSSNFSFVLKTFYIFFLLLYFVNVFLIFQPVFPSWKGFIHSAILSRCHPIGCSSRVWTFNRKNTVRWLVDRFRLFCPRHHFKNFYIFTDIANLPTNKRFPASCYILLLFRSPKIVLLQQQIGHWTS